MTQCLNECKKENKPCSDKNCKFWINFSEDLNCSMNTIQKNGNGMTLEDIGKRLNHSKSTIKLIQDKALIKIKKSNKLIFKVLE